MLVGESLERESSFKCWLKLWPELSLDLLWGGSQSRRGSDLCEAKSGPAVGGVVGGAGGT